MRISDWSSDVCSADLSAGQGEDRSMILLTPELRYALRANDIARRAADRDGKSAPNPVPVVKLFNPVGAATWLATELADDGDTLFGLAEIGRASCRERVCQYG